MNKTCQRCGELIEVSVDDELCPACVLREVMAVEGCGADAPSGSATGKRLPRRMGPYELREEWGRGGMGVVYRAHQLNLNRTVAVKVLIAGVHSSELTQRRFQLEAEAAAGLKHPNIVAIHDFGEIDGQSFYAMDLIAGRDLAVQCAGRPLPPRRAAEIVQVLAEAVQHAHEEGVLHRDLKPSNVIIDAQGRPHITDFGLAKRPAAPEIATLTGQALGSPGYMAPEQVRGRAGATSPATDIYGLGALLFHLLTGRAPYHAATPADTLRLVLETAPPPPRVLNPGLPRDLEIICLKCIEGDPARRFATAAELAEDLRRFLAGQPIRARPPSRLYLAGKYARRHWVEVSAVAAVFAALVVGLGFALASYRHASHQQQLTDSARTSSQEVIDGILHDMESRMIDGEPRNPWEQDDESWLANAQRALRYYETLAPDLRDPATIRSHARALDLVLRVRTLWIPAVFGIDPQVREAARLWRQVAVRDPHDPGAAATALRYEYVASGLAEPERGSPHEEDAGESLFENVSAQLRELAERDPRDPQVTVAFVALLRHRLVELKSKGEFLEGYALADELNERDARLVREHPENHLLLLEYTKHLRTLGYFYRFAGHRDLSREYRNEAISILRKMVAADPANQQLLGHLAQASSERTRTMTPGKLLADVREARAHLQRALVLEPGTTYWILWDANLIAREAYALSLDRRTEEAWASYQSALQIIEPIFSEIGAGKARWTRYVGALAALAAQAGDETLARDYLEQLRADRPIWVGQTEDEVDSAQRRFVSLLNERLVLIELGDWAQLNSLGQSLLHEVEGELSTLPEYDRSGYRAVAAAIYGEALWRQGRTEEALPWLELAVNRYRERGISMRTFNLPLENWRTARLLAEGLAEVGDFEGAREILEWTVEKYQLFEVEGAELLYRVEASRCSLNLAQVLDGGDPAQAKRRLEVLAWAAGMLNDPQIEPRLRPGERELLAQLESNRGPGPELVELSLSTADEPQAQALENANDL